MLVITYCSCTSTPSWLWHLRCNLQIKICNSSHYPWSSHCTRPVLRLSELLWKKLLTYLLTYLWIQSLLTSLTLCVTLDSAGHIPYCTSIRLTRRSLDHKLNNYFFVASPKHRKLHRYPSTAFGTTKPYQVVIKSGEGRHLFNPWGRGQCVNTGVAHLRSGVRWEDSLHNWLHYLLDGRVINNSFQRGVNCCTGHTVHLPTSNNNNNNMRLIWHDNRTSIQLLKITGSNHRR